MLLFEFEIIDILDLALRVCDLQTSYFSEITNLITNHTTSTTMNKAFTACTISGLRSFHKPSVISLLAQLHHRGFAVVNVDEDAKLSGLKVALSEAKKLQSFRFPEPMSEEIIYTEEKRLAFRTLFDLSLVSLRAILTEMKDKNHQIKPIAAASILRTAIRQAQEKLTLFSNPHEPFLPNGEQPFSQSFFNLFNYSNGLLNPHVDRSLVTVIYSNAIEPVYTDENALRSRLWVQGRNGKWEDADVAASRDDQIIIMTGEDLGEIGATLDLIPAPHAVKVDAATGEHVAKSHFRPDPQQQQLTINNRLSAAFILRHEPPSSVEAENC